MVPSAFSLSTRYTNLQIHATTAPQTHTCQCGQHVFDPWSGKISHAMGQLSPRTITAEALKSSAYALTRKVPRMPTHRYRKLSCSKEDPAQQKTKNKIKFLIQKFFKKRESERKACPQEEPFMCMYMCVLVIQLCSAICYPMAIACQALSMEFSRQESWSGLPFPSPEDLPNSGEPGSSASQADSLLSE